jgi:hypothetical protein
VKGKQVMVVEILAGIALAKSAVSGIKSAIDAAKDVNDIAHHIDDLFRGQDQIRKKVARDKKSKPKSKMRSMFSRKMGEDEDDDLSVGAVATMVLEQKKMDREILNLGIRIDNKFGRGTWDEIMTTRERLLEEHKLKVAKQKKINKEQAEESNEFWGKVWLFTWQSFVVVAGILVMWGWLASISRGQIPFLW